MLASVDIGALLAAVELVGPSTLTSALSCARRLEVILSDFALLEAVNGAIDSGPPERLVRRDWRDRGGRRRRLLQNCEGLSSAARSAAA